jgi:hypothetical protein
MGVNRYQPVADYDFEAGREYWAATADFWALVRHGWDQVYRDHEQFELVEEVDGTTMWMALFQLASDIQAAGEFDPEASKAQVGAIFDRHVKGTGAG